MGRYFHRLIFVKNTGKVIDKGLFEMYNRLKCVLGGGVA